ncbi:PUA-like domain-containing protein [Xylaria cf. heliscus]|nr:PUA-like domain-containing protein [Xylaria cf. heliscus]
MDPTTAVTADPVIKLEPDVSQSESESIVGPTVTVTDTIVKMENNHAQSVRVLNMGSTADHKEKMKVQGRSILTLCRNHRGRITPEKAEEMANRFADAELYLDWLETSLQMTPDIEEATKTHMVLSQLIDPDNNVPGNMVNKAKALLDKYMADNWGQDIVADEADDTQSLPTGAASAASPTIGVVQLPPDNDPVYGVNGIMYGIIVDTSGKRKDYRIRGDIPRTSAKVYGHNNIAIGTWYPFQINALFSGAHGARMAGIAGSVTSGAWSIVVAGTYEDLDTDNGDTLYYSGSNSHNNKDPQNAAPASQGTKALHASITTQNPVRVLRSGGAFNTRNKNRFLPSCGLRYDGLYRVVHYQQRLNRNGGLYDQFKLARLPGQIALDQFRFGSPTAQQVFAHDGLRGRF